MRAGLRSLREQGFRAALSALGISVGSFAIVLLVSIALGVREDLTRQVNDLGVNLLVVLPFRVSDSAMFSPNAAGVSYLKDEDLASIRKVEGVRRAAPLMFVGGSVRHGSKESPTTFIIAAGSDWFGVRPVTLAEGRVFGQSDEQSDVCVIGSIAKENLFGTVAALGKPVSINGHEYTVIGVTEDRKREESLLSFGSFENIAYIPYPVAKARVPNPQLHRIMIQTAPDVEPKNLVSSVEGTLAKSHERETFSVVTQKDLLKLVYKLMSILTWLLSGLTSIALVVGGVGIMTVMLMSVNERTKEIGIRKTVGAKRTDVFQQFFVEAVVLAIVGGLFGLLISYGASLALYYFTPIKPMLTSNVVFLALTTCLSLGALFGILPAVNAARKDPVVSLRSE